MSDLQSVWNLSGSTARLTTAHLQATINVCRPDLGISAITTCIDGEAVPWNPAQLLGVAAGSGPAEAIQPTDAYVRGNDLVVAWNSISSADINLQVYWRLLNDEAGGASGIETIVSAQTDLLDSDPTTRVGSLLPAGEVLRVSVGVDDVADEQDPSGQQLEVTPHEPTPLCDALLVRLADGRVSYLEMVHPADNGGASLLHSVGQLKSDYAVLTERLEKGVIRRSRLQGMFLPRDHDLSRARELYRQFIASAPPLTT